jgi:hypothetical protein
MKRGRAGVISDGSLPDRPTSQSSGSRRAVGAQRADPVSPYASQVEINAPIGCGEAAEGQSLETELSRDMDIIPKRPPGKLAQRLGELRCQPKS